MDLQELEIKAANLEPLPGRSELDWYEQNLFLSLRNIYSLYHSGVLSKENASAEKKIILAEYHKQRELASMVAANASRWADGVRESEWLRAAIHKAETKDEKGRLAMECVYKLTGDKTILHEAEAM